MCAPSTRLPHERRLARVHRREQRHAALCTICPDSGGGEADKGSREKEGGSELPHGNRRSGAARPANRQTGPSGPQVPSDAMVAHARWTPDSPEAVRRKDPHGGLRFENEQLQGRPPRGQAAHGRCLRQRVSNSSPRAGDSSMSLAAAITRAPGAEREQRDEGHGVGLSGRPCPMVGAVSHVRGVYRKERLVVMGQESP